MMSEPQIAQYEPLKLMHRSKDVITFDTFRVVSTDCGRYLIYLTSVGTADIKEVSGLIPVKKMEVPCHVCRYM
jgi:hypothetical protein